MKVLIDSQLEIKATRKKHDSGYRIIVPEMSGEKLSESSDLVRLTLIGGKYNIDVDKEGVIHFYPWGNLNKRVFKSDDLNGNTTYVREFIHEEKEEKEPWI